MGDREMAARARELEKSAARAQREARYGEAEGLLWDAIAIWEQLLGPEDVEVLNDRMNLAVAWRRGGQAARAVPALEKVSDELARCPHEDAPGIHLIALNALATAYRDVDAREKARDVWLRCLSVHDAPAGRAPHEERARVLDNLSVVVRELGDAVAAEAYARRGLEEWVVLRGEQDRDTAISKASLGAALLAQGRLDEAEPLLTASLRATEALGDELVTANTSTLLGALAHRRGEVAEARARFSRALDLARKHLPADHPEVRATAASLRALEGG